MFSLAIAVAQFQIGDIMIIFIQAYINSKENASGYDENSQSIMWKN